MIRKAAILAMVVAGVTVVTTQAVGAPSAKIEICGQKKGPSSSWSDTIPGVGTYRFRGNTWTVFATDVRCSFAMSVAPGHLSRWAKAKIGQHWRVNGWYCGKEKGRGYSGTGTSSGSIGCVGPRTAFIAIKMYAPYTLAQIRKVAATGRLPG